MNFKEIIWAHIPILIAIVAIVFSIGLTYSKRNFINGIISFFIILLNGFSIYILILIFNGAWPTYTPHLVIGISTIMVLIQWFFNKKG